MAKGNLRMMARHDEGGRNCETLLFASNMALQLSRLSGC